jgi:NifB/MoaA-like Fe-S oxidoreductase
LFFASDELYLMADEPFPPSAAYEDYAQHENGIGMARALYDEIDRLEHGEAVAGPLVTGEWRSIPAAPAEGYRAPRHTGDDPSAPPGPAVVVTGEYGARVLAPVLHRLEALVGRPLRILTVRNEFFAGNVAVAGLLVGRDLTAALASDADEAALYLLPDVALQGDRFLDDTSLVEVAAAAKAPVVAVEATVRGLIDGASQPTAVAS